MAGNELVGKLGKALIDRLFAGLFFRERINVNTENISSVLF